MSFISIQDLTFYRGSRIILQNLALEVAQGSLVGIMGPSGCGKTTLLNFLGGKLKPTSGKVYIDGTDIHKLNQRELLHFRKNLGFLFQNGALFTDMNVYQNVAFPLKVHYKLPRQVIADLVYMKLECVGLRGAAKLRPGELSGGMNRRVALARALALDPSLMFYDEPFTGQDPINKGVIMELIKKVNDNLGITSFLVSHDIPETLKIADYVYILADGKIIGSGTPASLAQDKSPLVQQFIHGRKEGPVPFHYPAEPLRQGFGLTTGTAQQ